MHRVFVCLLLYNTLAIVLAQCTAMSTIAGSHLSNLQFISRFWILTRLRVSIIYDWGCNWVWPADAANRQEQKTRSWRARRAIVSTLQVPLRGWQWVELELEALTPRLLDCHVSDVSTCISTCMHEIDPRWTVKCFYSLSLSSAVHVRSLILY